MFAVSCSLTSAAVCLSDISCSSSSVGNPFPQQTVGLSGEARCFPHLPTLLAKNSSGNQLAISSDVITQPPQDAYTVQLNVNVTQSGNYSFEIDGQNVTEVEEIRCKHMTGIVVNCWSKLSNFCT